MISKFRVAFTLATIALLTAESNAIKLEHELTAEQTTAATSVPEPSDAEKITQDCADGNCEASLGDTDVTIKGAEEGEVAVAIDDNDEPCGDSEVKIDITMNVDGDDSGSDDATNDG